MNTIEPKVAPKEVIFGAKDTEDKVKEVKQPEKPAEVIFGEPAKIKPPSKEVIIGEPAKI